MACTSITALPRTCPPDLVQGGVQELYMISHSDLNKPYVTYSVSGLISDISIATGKQYVQVGLVKNTANLAEELTKSIEAGTAFYTQTFTVLLMGMTSENIAFVESVVNQPVSIVFKTKTGNHYGIGFDGNIEVTGVTSATGTAEADMVGYTLTFTGTSGKLARMVDPTLIPVITAPAE